MLKQVFIGIIFMSLDGVPLIAVLNTLSGFHFSLTRFSITVIINIIKEATQNPVLLPFGSIPNVWELFFYLCIGIVLRTDPDVIAVGELRDLETIAIAVTAAETGHLVFATLHTRSAAETVNRMIDVFPDQQQRQIRVQLAGSLQAVVSQQLLPDKKGGRTAAFEIMIVTPALRNLIREGKTQQMESFIQTGRQYGMQTMEAAVEKLKIEGII